MRNRHPSPQAEGRADSRRDSPPNISWETCLHEAERQILVCEQRIKRLRDSAHYFRQQIKHGVPFPCGKADAA